MRAALPSSSLAPQENSLDLLTLAGKVWKKAAIFMQLLAAGECLRGGGGGGGIRTEANWCQLLI